MNKGPNVLVAGFSRCATTYLFNLLKQHNDVFIPEEKEVNYLHKYPLFLSHPHLVNIKFFFPRSLYYKKFKTKKPIKVDFSVLTAYDKTSAARIRRELGDIKIIFITRNKDEHKKSVAKTMKNHGEKVKFDLGMYGNFEEYIKPYRKSFENVLVLRKEDLEKDPGKTLRNIWNFLGVHEQDIDLWVYQNKSATYFKDKHKSNKAYRIFRGKRNLLKAGSYILTAFVK